MQPSQCTEKLMRVLRQYFEPDNFFCYVNDKLMFPNNKKTQNLLPVTDVNGFYPPVRNFSFRADEL